MYIYNIAYNEAHITLLKCIVHKSNSILNSEGPHGRDRVYINQMVFFPWCYHTNRTLYTWKWLVHMLPWWLTEKIPTRVSRLMLLPGIMPNDPHAIVYIAPFDFVKWQHLSSGSVGPPMAALHTVGVWSPWLPSWRRQHAALPGRNPEPEVRHAFHRQEGTQGCDPLLIPYIRNHRPGASGVRSIALPARKPEPEVRRAFHIPITKCECVPPCIQDCLCGIWATYPPGSHGNLWYQQPPPTEDVKPFTPIPIIYIPTNPNIDRHHPYNRRWATNLAQYLLVNN